MAITKTYLYNSAEATSRQNVLEYLQANAVPDYFDSVDTDGNCISCKVGEHEVLKIYPTLTQSGGGFQFYTTNGTSLWINSNSSNMRIAYAYKCKHGISFTFLDNSIVVAMVTIAKCKNGLPVIIAPSGLSISAVGSVSAIYAVGLNSGAIIAYPAKSAIAPMTVLAPIPACDVDNTCADGVYFLPYTQTQETGQLSIDGVRYLSNGLWCVKDE